MERITYRKTLDVHKSGTQFLLQGFETADNMSRVIEISLMASGDAIDFPLERLVAMMYVTTPGATEPSINECTIEDNKVVYDVLPIVVEGITTMQLKLIETGPDGATSVLASPKFSVEVTKSDADDGKAEKTTTFTALEEAMAKAKIAYDERFLRMELSSDCIFRAYYADGTTYETDVLKKLFLNGNVLLSESFAHGGTGVRAGEDTDNSKYYSDVARSEALNAKNIMEDSKDVLEDVRLHGVYTAFSVDFETGEVEYVSPSFKFKVNPETGELDAEGQAYTFEDEIGRVVEAWLGERGVALSELQAISSRHSEEIADLHETVAAHTEDIEELNSEIKPIEKGGTGATTAEGALGNLGVEPRLSDLEWVSLGSVFCESETYGKLTYHIPCDVNMLSEFRSFRYIIHPGANFYAKATNLNNNSYTDVAIVVSAYNSVFRVDARAVGNNNEIKEVSLVLDEPLISYHNNISAVNSFSLNADDGICKNNCIAINGNITVALEQLTDITVNVSTSVTGNDTTGFSYDASYSFTIELQGKR